MFMFCSYVEAEESMVYSYTKSFNAFAAKLSSDEAERLSGMSVTEFGPNIQTIIYLINGSQINNLTCYAS